MNKMLGEISMRSSLFCDVAAGFNVLNDAMEDAAESLADFAHSVVVSLKRDHRQRNLFRHRRGIRRKGCRNLPP